MAGSKKISSKKNSLKPKAYAIAIIALVVVVVVLAILIFAFNRGSRGLIAASNTANNTANNIANNISNTSSQSISQNLLASINGEQVTSEEVLAVYNTIPIGSRNNASLQQSLDQVISNKLLVQDGIKKGLSANDTEIDNAISTLLASNGVSAAVLEQNLNRSGLSMSEFRDNLRKEIILRKEVFEITKDAPTPTEADITAYYNATGNNITSPASAKTRQILVYANQTNKDQKLTQIQEVAVKLNSTNFCELVARYSEDANGKANCGEIDFKKGDLIPEYEEVVFNTTPGATKLFASRLGYHIVQVLSINASRQLSFAEAKQGISDYLTIIKKQTALNIYINKLRDSAQIISYMK